MVVRIVLLLSLLLLSSISIAKGLTARVDRTQVGLGESIELIVAMSDIRGDRPDTAELQKDFSIERQSQGSNVQIINGVVSHEARWTFLLSPNRKGKLTIPALKVGRYRTNPIEITVTDTPVAQSTSDDVLMEVELSPADPYVQSQVAYIQRLYFSRPLVDSASISSPKLSKGEADIQFWGSSDPRYVTHKNRPYQLIERYYLVYPQKAGVLEFEPSIFNGSLASSKQRNDFQMNMFRTGTRVSAYSGKATVTIKEKPDSFSSEHWLPASQLTLSMNFSQPPETLKVGEPVTITIALLAEGLKAEVLPEIKLDLPDNIKSYPEKPSFRTDKVRNGMVGQRQEKIVLIANEAGEYVIPEVTIPWWSVTEDKQKIAKLDAVIINVAGGLVSESSKFLGQSDMEAKKEELTNKALDSDEPSENSSQSGSDAAGEANKILISQRSSLVKFFEENKNTTLVGLFSGVGLILLGWCFWRSRKSHITSNEYQQKIVMDEAISALETACRKNNLKSAVSALPKWAEAVGIHPPTMAGIELAGDAELAAEVKVMSAASYSPNPIEWNGESLLQAAKQFSATSSARPQVNVGLRPLHPISS